MLFMASSPPTAPSPPRPPNQRQFASSAMFNAAELLEILTPYFPQHFLPMASLANMGARCGVAPGGNTRERSDPV